VKKTIEVLTVILFSVFLVFLTACDFTSAKLEDVVVSAGVDKSNLPLDVTDVFEVDSSVIYVTGSAQNVPDGTTVSIEWIYLETDPETLIDSVDLVIEDTNTDFAFSLTKPTNGWPVGEYEAVLYIDDELQLSVTFTVEAPSDEVDTTITTVISTLEAGSYVMESRDAESIAYFQLNMVNNKYDLNTTVVSCWLGYVNQVERWVEVVEFSTVAEAESYVVELGIEATEGRLVYRDGNVVLATYSQDTIDLFD